jgi:hypothetical protein
LKTSSKGKISGFDQPKPTFSSNILSDRFDGGSKAYGSSRLKGESRYALVKVIVMKIGPGNKFPYSQVTHHILLLLF